MDLVEVVKATYAVIGQEASDLQIAMTVEELSSYPEQNVLTALSRCRKELRKLTLADILDRLPGGHLGVEEAWSKVSQCMNNEQISIVWTDEMRQAYGAAAPLADDKVAARMAFKEVYTKLVNESRTSAKLPSWSVSLGFDKSLRQEAIEEAVRLNQISQSQASKLLPPLTLRITRDMRKLVDNIGDMNRKKAS